MVGVNRYRSDDEPSIPVARVDPALEDAQRRRVDEWRRGRNGAEVEKVLAEVAEAASTSANMLYPMKAALTAGATIGEVSDALRSVFGEYRPV